MQFAVLGPVEVRRDGRGVALGGPKQRALLAILLLRADEVVSRDRLIEGLWGERPPPTADHTLDNYVSRLRKVIGDDRISRRPPGYVVHVHDGELDLQRFTTLLEAGRAQLGRHEPKEAAATFRNALALWRGPALADVLYEPFAAHEAQRLEDLRLSALENRIEADLEVGAGSELVPELEGLVREHAFRERLIGQLMLALYRAGRQTEALSAFQKGRQRLAEELGLEPGPELHELQRRILEHDETLLTRREGRTPARRPRRPGPKSLAAVGVATVVLAASVALGIMLGTGSTGAPDVDSSSSRLVALNADSATRVHEVELPGAPSALSGAQGSLWLADPNAGSVARVDLDDGVVVDRIPVGGSPGVIAAGGGAVWVASVSGDEVTRIDPATGAVTQRLPLGGARVAALAVGADAIWLGDVTDNALIEVDPASGGVRRRVPLPVRPTAIAVEGGALWVADYGEGSVAEVNARSGHTVATIRVGRGPTALDAVGGAVWVANTLDSTVSRIDRATGSVAATVPVGSGPTGIAIAKGSVWVANEHSSSVSRIDQTRNVVVDTTAVGGSPTTLVAADDTVWVGVRPVAQHRGGTLVLQHTRPISIDPALNVDLLPPVSEGLTRDGLVTYNHVGGPAGIQLVPDLAVSIPIPTDGGRTYIFRLRPAIRYSDGRLLRAADFRRAIERLFRLGSDGRALFEGIRGAEKCGTAQCDLAGGIGTDDGARTVTFRLRRPDPVFLNSLAEHGLATAVPAGTPFRDTGLHPIPGTGPYKIASASTHEVRYVRNPFFREWSHAAKPDGNPDEIILRFGLLPGQETQAIEEGRADWSADNIPASLVPRLETRYPSQLHGFSIPTTDFFKLNTTLAPFDDVRVRRALNFALDRGRIARIYGGRDLATPTCQILPPGIAGYRRYCPYTRGASRSGRWAGPDIPRARKLVEASGTRGTPIAVWGWTDDPTIVPAVVRYTARLLRQLGYRTRTCFLPHAFSPIPRGCDPEAIQLIPAGWGGDPPYGFFRTWFSCSGSATDGFFCDPRVDRAIARAQAVGAASPRAASARWAAIDRQLVDRAAWAPFVNEHALDFVSARLANYLAHPFWGMLADQVWVR